MPRFFEEPFTKIENEGQQKISNNTAALVPASPNDKRVQLDIVNTDGSATVYWGGDNTVTASTGEPIYAKGKKELRFPASQPIWIFNGSGGDVTVSYKEYSA